MAGKTDGNIGNEPIYDWVCPDCEAVISESRDYCEVCGYTAPTVEDREPTDEELDKLLIGR